VARQRLRRHPAQLRGHDHQHRNGIVLVQLLETRPHQHAAIARGVPRQQKQRGPMRARTRERLIARRALQRQTLAAEYLRE